jgi:hypothetical protein
MSTWGRRPLGWRLFELIALTATAFLLANTLLIRAAFEDASWLALSIQILFGPLVNVALGAAAIYAHHRGIGRELSPRVGLLFRLAVVCGIVIAIKTDFSLIEAVPKNGC